MVRGDGGITPWRDRSALEPASLCRRFESRWSCPRGASRIARVCDCYKTRREAEAEENVVVFAAAAASRPPVCFGADAAPSLAARGGAAASSAPRSPALQQRAAQSGYRHELQRRAPTRPPFLILFEQAHPMIASVVALSLALTPLHEAGRRGRAAVAMSSSSWRPETVDPMGKVAHSGERWGRWHIAERENRR